MSTFTRPARADGRTGVFRSRMAAVFAGPGSTPLPSRARILVLATLAAVAGTAVVLLRIPRADWNIPWAEDGAVFLRDALETGPVALVQPYAGYLHIVPRLLAEITTLVPLSLAPAVLTVSAAATVGLVSAGAAVLLASRVTQPALVVAAWLCTFALPIMGGEVLGSIANLHWFLLVAAACAMFTPTVSRGTAVLQTCLLCAAVLSDPLGVMLLPLVVVRWWVHRGRREAAVLVAFALASAVQLAGTIASSVIGSDRVVSSTRPSIVAFAGFYAHRVVETGLLGVSGTLAAESAFPTGAAVAVAAASIGLLVAALVLAPRWRAGVVLFVAASVGFAAVVWSLQWEFLAGDGALALGHGDRYAVVPVALFMVGMVLAADGLIGRVRAGSVRWVLAVVVLVAVAVPCVVDARVFPKRAGTPSWSAQLEAARPGCETSPESAVELQIAPTPYIRMQLSCRTILAH